jgi:hypothetical protein
VDVSVFLLGLEWKAFSQKGSRGLSTILREDGEKEEYLRATA